MRTFKAIMYGLACLVIGNAFSLIVYGGGIIYGPGQTGGSGGGSGASANSASITNALGSSDTAPASPSLGGSLMVTNPSLTDTPTVQAGTNGVCIDPVTGKFVLCNIVSIIASGSSFTNPTFVAVGGTQTGTSSVNKVIIIGVVGIKPEFNGGGIQQPAITFYNYQNTNNMYPQWQFGAMDSGGFIGVPILYIYSNGVIDVQSVSTNQFGEPIAGYGVGATPQGGAMLTIGSATSNKAAIFQETYAGRHDGRVGQVQRIIHTYNFNGTDAPMQDMAGDYLNIARYGLLDGTNWVGIGPLSSGGATISFEGTTNVQINILNGNITTTGSVVAAGNITSGGTLSSPVVDTPKIANEVNLAGHVLVTKQLTISNSLFYAPTTVVGPVTLIVSNTLNAGFTNATDSFYLDSSAGMAAVTFSNIANAAANGIEVFAVKVDSSTNIARVQGGTGTQAFSNYFSTGTALQYNYDLSNMNDWVRLRYSRNASKGTNWIVVGSSISIGFTGTNQVLSALPSVFTTYYYTNGLLKGISTP